MVLPFKSKLLCSSFLWYGLLIMMYKVVLTFESVNKMVAFKCRKATEQYFPVVLLIMSYKVV